MFELSATAYLWIKALHVISVVSWMAGLLYLPRLFVYHAQVEAGTAVSETLKVMERRLLRAIMNPAMIASWAFGLTMAFELQAWDQGWLHAKLAGVGAMTGMHMVMARWRRDFAEDRNARGHKFYRVANEVPTLLMIAVVIFVVVKPF
jgi:putative membrane protein